jgi:four helix bundle protein
MNKINTFEDLKIWQDGSDVAVNIYQITSQVEMKRDYGLKDQLQRAALSITNNIAEGFEYNNNKDFIKFLRYAKGSTGEVRSMLNILLRLNLISEEEFNSLYPKLIELSKFEKLKKEN